MTTIGEEAFSACTGLTDVYYMGSAEGWNNISISSGNTYLTGATRHYALNVNYIINSDGSVWQTAKAFPNNAAQLTEDVPSRPGYAFLGWTDAADMAEAKYQPGDTITAGTEDINLYAVWKKIIYTKTAKINGIFMVTPTGVPVGSSIMLACYKDGRIVHAEKFEYDGSTVVPFSVSEEYDAARVFVWDSLNSMIPVTEAEDVKLQ